MSHIGQADTAGRALARPQGLAAPGVDPSRRRYLVASDGRAGSTLMTAILAAAGADLGMPAVERWNPLGGAHEHPGLDRLNRSLEQALWLTESASKVPGLAVLARLSRSRAKAQVRRLMARGQCVKCSPLAAAYVYKIGLMPQVIAVYRDFGDLARSKMLLERMPWPTVANRALDTYRNALLAIHTFGGCAIAYEDMVDPEQGAWLKALADCTGLDRQALAEARARIARPRPHPRPAANGFHLDDRLDSLARDLAALRGRYVPPSLPYLRAAAAAG
jgi:hypothetical protein